jgi:hypothetical protein
VCNVGVVNTAESDVGEIHPLPPHLVLSRTSTDLHFYIVGSLATANELMLQATLTAFHDAVSLLLRGQIEKRNVLEGLDLVLLAADETVDDGSVTLPLYRVRHPDSCCRIILETDAAAIASRVSRPKADTTDIVINEQTIMSACTYSTYLSTRLTRRADSTIKERMVQRIGQL